MLIPDISCKGFTLKINELTIEQAIDVSLLPQKGCYEKNITTFLGFVFGEAVGGISSNPKLWTCSQRYLAIAMYLAYILDDGFGLKVNDKYILDDYLNTTLQNAAPTLKNDDVLELIMLGDDVHGDNKYSFVQLLGWHVEAIETVAENYTDWLFCAMAACLRVDNEILDYPYDENTSTYDYAQFLIKRVDTFKKYPESLFVKLNMFFMEAFTKHSSFFKLWFDDVGVVALHNKEGIDDIHYESLRFCVSDTVSRATKYISGRNDQLSG